MADLPVVELQHEGDALEGRIALPSGPGPHPAVLVMASAHGLGSHVRMIAQRLADDGYVAIATDMYGGGAHHTDGEKTGAAMMKLCDNPDLLRARVRLWLATLKARPEVDAERVAAIGYCFGGQCVLELARSGADVKAVVSYHGLLTTKRPAEPGAIRAKVAVYTGAKDPWAPREDVAAFEDEMRAADASWQITVFGDAYHAFAMQDDGALPMEGLAYDALSDELSWAGTIALLKHVF